MQIASYFLSAGDSAPVLSGYYSGPMVLLSVAVAVLAGVMALQLAGMARVEIRPLNRQIYMLSGAFVLGAGIWSMHFIGMLAFSVCSVIRYDPLITLLSMLPGFLASWVALMLLSKDQINRWQLVVSGVTVGAGIGTMHYSGMAAVHNQLELRFEPVMFGLSIIVAVALSVSALWLRFRLTNLGRLNQQRINLVSGMVLGVAISGMHYTGMAATRFLAVAGADAQPVANVDLALSIFGITTLAILVTVGGNFLLRYRVLFQRMVQTEAGTRTILETAVDGIITIDSKGIVRGLNGAAETIFGWDAREVIGQNVSMLMPEPQRSQHDSYLSNYLTTGIAKIIGQGREVMGLRKNGTTFPLRLAIGEASLGNETLFVGFITDISERKKMEEALLNSEQQYRSLIGNLPGIAFRCRPNPNRSMLFISDAVTRLTGWAPADFTSGAQSLAELVHPDDRDAAATMLTDMLDGESSYQIEYRIVDRAGGEHWVSESASAVRSPDGVVEWVDGVIIDITDGKRRAAEFEGVVTAIGRSLSVIEFDLHGTILQVNQNYLTLTGYAADELVGRHHSVLCDAQEVSSAAYRAFWDGLRAGRHQSGEFHRKGKHGKDIWIQGSYNPILDPDGRPYKIIKLASDLSERHAMELDLREAKAKAEQAAEAKNTFLANMSHEIRTPMNAILGFTEVLLGEPVSDTQRRHLATVRNAARSLLTLLNDILDTAKLERGAVELEERDFSLRDVCMHVLATLRINAQAKALPLVLDYPDGLPEFYRGDALRVQQVLLNLVGNAVKFTEKGQVTLRVRVSHDGVLCMDVIDTGIGIPADRVSRIFDPFAQADASMTRRFGGTGLGTTIARQLIELMHGRIWVESELGNGSVFHIEVPLPVGEAVQLPQDLPAVDLPPLRILAADDVPQNLELLALLLGRQGHDLTTAANGQEAVQACMQGQFDVVLMDVQMPVLNGLDASRQIRQWEVETGRAPTPIIAFTASVLEDDVRQAREAGMNGFAIKPVDLHRLTQEIARLLHLESGPVAKTSPTGPAVAVRGSVIDWDKGGQMWGSEPRHRDAIRRFLQEYGSIVVRLRELQAQPDALVAQAHKLRGASANLALSRVSNLCALLEERSTAGGSGDASGMLDQLADELMNVSEALAQLSPESVLSPTRGTPLDREQLRPLLLSLDSALARGELDEAALATLATLLADDELQALNQAIDSFDFDAARSSLCDLRNRYLAEGDQA